MPTPPTDTPSATRLDPNDNAALAGTRAADAHLAGTLAADAHLVGTLAADAHLAGTLAAPDVRSAVATPAALAAGGRLGRFVVLRPLGAGGMGTVYAAYDEELGRRLAVKLLHARPGGTLGRGRLLREAQAMARLSHPNVVQIYEVGEHGPDVFVAMEYVEGGTLESWRHARAREPAEVVAMYVQAGRGLAAAHAAGLVHRDFKPENVLVGPDERPRVGDFGLARARGSHDLDDPGASMSNPGASRSDVLASPLTATGVLTGTPAYMSPEQFHGGPVDAASDQFSFCAALYEALYGRRPFAGETMAELILHVTGGDLLPPPADTGVPPRLFEHLRRGLAVDPRARWPSIDALLDQLAVDPQRDTSAAPRERRRLALAMGLAVAAIVTTITILESGVPPDQRPPSSTLIPTALAFTLVVGVTLVFRARLWPHPFHRNVLCVSLLVTGHSLALRILLVGAGLSYDAITTLDMLLHPFLCLAAAILVARWFLVVGAIPLAGGLVALAVPDATARIAMIVFPAQALVLVHLWTRDTVRRA